MPDTYCRHLSLLEKVNALHCLAAMTWQGFEPQTIFCSFHYLLKIKNPASDFWLQRDYSRSNMAEQVVRVKE